MKRLIVNADDLGMATGVNRAICEAHARGIVTSASLLANGAAFAEAVELACATPSLGIGVHLNLTSGRPVARESQISTLVDARGMMRHTPASLAVGMAAGRVPAAEVERELRAQVEKVLAAGITPTHFDGHHHAHMLPQIFPLAARLAQEYGIGAMRCTVERPIGIASLLRRFPARSVLREYLGGRVLGVVAFCCDFRGVLRRAGLAAPDYFLGLTHTGHLDSESLLEIFYNLPPGTSELMCHPGYADASLAATGTRLAAERERELEALTQPAALKALQRLRAARITFGDLWPRE